MIIEINTLEEMCDLMCDNKLPEDKGMYECFNCGCRSVIWDNDFMFDECGYEGYGIVHFCHCQNCGAEIEYRVPMEEDEQ